jgi:hypothetical protein
VNVLDSTISLNNEFFIAAKANFWISTTVLLLALSARPWGFENYVQFILSTLAVVFIFFTNFFTKIFESITENGSSSQNYRID